MLRGNLATRPFYNERLVTMALAAVAIVALLFSAFNVTRVLSLSRERSRLNTRIEQNRAETEAALSRASALRASVNDATLASLAGATRTANNLIGARTFSWTSFFGLIEKTMPFDVRLVAVTPRVEEGVFKVAMVVIGRDLTDVDAFIDALSATGSFYDVAPTSQSLVDDGTYSAVISASYLSPAGKPAVAPVAPASPASATTPAPAPRAPAGRGAGQ